MNKLIFFVIILLAFSCNTNNDDTTGNNVNLEKITKPKGIFSSSFGNELALDNIHTKGSLIRVTWKDIEPNQGVYDFSKIEQFLSALKSRNLKWSLAIIAGGDSPSWLIDKLGVDYFTITSRDNTLKRIPKIWDSKVNQRLELLAQALASTYGSNDDLELIYVPQMTTNGIEGHFNGVTDAELTTAGVTSTNWVNSVKETAKIFATAFTNKAIAVEVHDIMHDTSIPTKIMTDLWNDESLNHRVGAAIWWISGKTSYQPNLIDALTLFPGDIYAQVIGRSDQTERFENNDYTTVFSQAKKIGIRYIEVWEYELVNNTFPQEFNDFNEYATTSFE